MSWLLGAAIAMSAISQGTGVAPPVRTITLEEALRIAETSAFGIRIAETNVERSRQRVAEARGALGPRVNGQLQYTRFGTQGTTNFGGQTFVTSPIDSTQAQISLALPFDITGTTRKAINAAQLQYEAQQELLEAQVNDVRLSVKRAYFGVLQAQAQLGVAEEAVQRAEDRVRLAEDQFRAGVVARVDVLRFETSLSVARNDVIAAQSALQLAKNNFNNTLGIAIETPVALAEVTAVPPLERDPQQLVGEALANRPELRAQELVVEALGNLRQSEERGMNPSLALSAVQSRNLGSAGQSPQRDQTTGVLTLSVPIYDAGITRARVRAARQDEAQARIQLEQAQLGISLEVRQALTNLTNAEARLNVAQKSVELAEEVYRLARVRYEAGEGIQLEVTDAQTELTRARTAVVSARYDYLRAFAEVERATGTERLTAPRNETPQAAGNR